MILSPNFPRKYLLNTSCDWWIYARSPMNRIMIQFMVFELEGTQTGTFSYGLTPVNIWGHLC